MRDFIAERRWRGGAHLGIRIGVHTGPVVAGIVGKKKFQYDVWGDTVNTAARMESSGAVGQVNISQATHDLLGSRFNSPLAANWRPRERENSPCSSSITEAFTAEPEGQSGD